MCLSWICELCQRSCCVTSCFFFLPFLCLSLSPPFNSPPSFLIQHINEGQICTRGRKVYVCSRAWLSALFNSVDAGWLAGAAAGKRLQRRLRLGLCYRTQLSFPPWRAPLSPQPREVSLLLPSPRHTPPPPPSPPTLPLPSPPPPHPSPPTHPLLSYTPSAPSCNIQPRGRVTKEGGRWGRGGLQRFSLTQTHTHPGRTWMCVCVCTLNLPKQFFQCNWAWGTCVHEIAQPLLHASCSGVYVPLLALQCRQLPNHILTGVFERLLSTERERGR